MGVKSGLIKGNHSGIYHSAPPLKISRKVFAVMIANEFGLDTSLIEGVSMESLGRDSKSSLNKCLNSMKLFHTGFKFMNLDDSLRQLELDSWSPEIVKR